MRFNENTAVSTDKLLLVPYDAHHVPQYHKWMSDPAIQEATASDPLTLEEEYENQQSWRTSHDKLTFIVCQPLGSAAVRPSSKGRGAVAGEDDRAERMVGDVNLFLTPWEEDDEAEESQAADANADNDARFCVGEIDIMIADQTNRGKGVGKATVATFIRFILSHRDKILNEYGTQTLPAGGAALARWTLRDFMVKIKASNEHSISLFRGLGFKQVGDVNYFGEIQMGMNVLDWTNDDAVTSGPSIAGYEEIKYDRPIPSS